MIRPGLSLLRPPLQSLKAGVLLSTVAAVVLAGCGGGGNDAASGVASVCDPDDGGLTLPDGFCATVVADSLGQPRHLAVADNGDVYAALRETSNGGGAVALRDTDDDYKADETEYFGEMGGTGMALHDGDLYQGTANSIVRCAKEPGTLRPSGEQKEIVRLPDQESHAAKPVDFDGNGNLYVADDEGSTIWRIAYVGEEGP